MAKQQEGRHAARPAGFARVAVDLSPGAVDQLDALADVFQRGNLKRVTRAHVVRRAIQRLYLAVMEDGEKGGVE